MLEDIVIDTNVIVHSYKDANNVYFIDAQAFMMHFLNPKCNCAICFDDGFDPIESKNRSAIYTEYRNHLWPGSILAAIIAFGSDRIRILNKKVPANINRIINKTGIKKMDRIFVRIAYNSKNKRLVSHDKDDFNISRRQYFNSQLLILITTASETIEEIRPS